MIYLDHGFSRQFPFYHPTLTQGGRAWLLPLLTCTKPAYYATLTLGALYWRRSLNVNYDEELIDTLKQDEERYHLVALQELRLFITEKMSLENCLSALACIMQLFCYEVGSSL